MERNILRQFENFDIYKDLYGKPLKRDWVAKVVCPAQILLIFGDRCISLLLKYKAGNLTVI